MKKIAGIDVHKKVLMVVIAEAASPEQIVRKDKFGTGRAELERLRVWLQQTEVGDVVMESTAQYWRPVWNELEPFFALQLAHAINPTALPKAASPDWADARRLVKRFAAEELFLSFVPEPEQRDWRTLTRARQALVRDHVHLQNQIEALLEQASIKLSSVVSDLFGLSSLRILSALAEGQTDAEKLAQLADPRLRCGQQTLVDALRGRFREVHRQLLDQALQRLAILSKQIAELSRLAAQRLQPYASTLERLIEVCLALALKRHKKSWRKSDPLQRPSPPAPSWHPGSESVREPRNRLEKTTPALVALKATATFAACYAKWPMPPPAPKEVTSRSCFESSCIRDTTKPSGRWHTNYARSSGLSCTMAPVTLKAVWSIPRPSNALYNSTSRPCAGSDTSCHPPPHRRHNHDFRWSS